MSPEKKFNEEYVDVSNTMSIDYVQIFLDLVKRWKIFVVFALLGFAVAYVYVNRIIPVYRISTILMINTSTEEFTPPSNDLITGMNFFATDRSFYNEISVLNSYPIIFNALSNLNFEVSYFETEFLKTRELYQNAPFIVVFNPGHPQPTGLKIHVKFLNDNQVEISARGKDIVTYSFQTKTEIERLEKLSIEETVPLGEEITSHYYRFKIVPNENFSFDDIAGKSYYFTINNLGAMANFYKEELNLSLYNEQSTVAIVDLLVNNTPKGIQFLNSLTQEYIKQNLSKKNQMAEATIDYINNQLDMISDSLSIAEEKLQEFRTRYQVHNLDTKAEQIFAQLQILQSEKATLTVKQRYYESIKERFDSNEEVSDLIAPSSMGIDDPLLGNLVAEFAELNSQKVTLIDNSQERSPYLKSLEIKIANLRNTIYENIKYNLNTNEFTLENLNSRIRRLNNELSSMPATERQLMGIQREFNLQDEVYNFLLQRRAEAQIAKASNFPTVEVVEPPRRIGRTAVLPKKKANYLLGIIIGLLIPLSILLLRILIRNVVSSYDEVVSVSRLPRIGNVVHQKDLKDKHIIFNEPDAPISESFRKVIANMRYLKVNPKQLTILVTSSIAGEGKSFIAYNLASAFAMQKRKTILLSFDMRKPDFYEDLGFQMEEGMSTVVSSRTDVDKATVNTANPFLTIIPPGPTPPNPSELIASAETAKLIKQLKTSNEVVIIDTPPAGLLADASYLMDLVNINLYVVRIGHTPRSIFRTTIQEMKSKDIENLCLLVNGMPPDKKGYGYHSSYYKSDRKTRRRRARKKKADKKKNA